MCTTQTMYIFFPRSLASHCSMLIKRGGTLFVYGNVHVVKGQGQLWPPVRECHALLLFFFKMKRCPLVFKTLFFKTKMYI